MPHAELKYSNDLALDAQAILAAVEQVIQRHDPGAGACKGRAYPAPVFHHSHVLLSLSLLAKPHRDAAFTRALMAEVEVAVKALILQDCYFSFDLAYNTATYVTNRHEVAR
ncbi:hypothetical protein [Maliponia aquimaris]|uniref:5-carboxymethyl-2-hydroxymuconate isomerase n=1 Tax=Maliponia aquimaris TaxID=1673631 RepID=A0A238KL00_9RHOB|nr:hypothetical protein [Maliponia aquimaris]SMX43423.1 hypothetical protein MAA8898_02822 [Maliponia aquimaris]